MNYIFPPSGHLKGNVFQVPPRVFSTRSSQGHYPSGNNKGILCHLTLSWPGFQNYIDGLGRADLPYLIVTEPFWKLIIFLAEIQCFRFGRADLPFPGQDRVNEHFSSDHLKSIFCQVTSSQTKGVFLKSPQGCFPSCHRRGIFTHVYQMHFLSDHFKRKFAKVTLWACFVQLTSLDYLSQVTSPAPLHL